MRRCEKDSCNETSRYYPLLYRRFLSLQSTPSPPLLCARVALLISHVRSSSPDDGERALLDHPRDDARRFSRRQRFSVLSFPEIPNPSPEEGSVSRSLGSPSSRAVPTDAGEQVRRRRARGWEGAGEVEGPGRGDLRPMILCGFISIRLSLGARAFYIPRSPLRPPRAGDVLTVRARTRGSPRRRAPCSALVALRGP